MRWKRVRWKREREREGDGGAGEENLRENKILSQGEERAECANHGAKEISIQMWPSKQNE